MAKLLRSTEKSFVNQEILNLKARVVFFPVRHHSPTAAQLVSDLIEEIRPRAVLIEGPSDYNKRIGELFLPHKLPIAIYTYFRDEKSQRGAFYPFCIYSPEWQALQAARKIGTDAAFIDMPWQDMANAATCKQRYADGELREGNFIDLSCKRLGLENFDALWDELIEAPVNLSPAEYMRRCHNLCYQMRHSRREVNLEDLVREAFMAAMIQESMQAHSGRILVVTGGFHSHALFERVHGIYKDLETEEDDSTEEFGASEEKDSESGIALTPYSYARLDSLTGYEAGMPSPGFYHQMYMGRDESDHETFKRLLFDAATSLRNKHQPVSSADLIAVETSARVLARLRGHERVWRTDLIDGIMSALVKDEIVSGLVHPMLESLYEVFRGNAKGELAKGTTLPPLVDNITSTLEDYGLYPKSATGIEFELELTAVEDLAKSRILHQLSCLGIAGFSLFKATELSGDEQGKILEEWTIKWTPNFDANCIESSVYGATLIEAASNRLLEACSAITNNSEQAAAKLSEACSMGLSELGAQLCQRLKVIIGQDQRFHSVALCAARLLYLFKYDTLLTDKPLAELGSLLRNAFDRSLWLLESLGKATGNDSTSIKAISALVDIIENCGTQLGLDRGYLVEVFTRARLDRNQAAVVCGALTGALWVLAQAHLEEISSDMVYFSEPQSLGDFLTGLFHLAREVLQRSPELIAKLDAVLMSYDDEQFLEAAPSMRQAFAFFSPREKHYIAEGILKSTVRLDAGNAQLSELELLAPLTVNMNTAARALLIEARTIKALKKYGIREVE